MRVFPYLRIKYSLIHRNYQFYIVCLHLVNNIMYMYITSIECIDDDSGKGHENGNTMNPISTCPYISSTVDGHAFCY